MVLRSLLDFQDQVRSKAKAVPQVEIIRVALNNLPKLTSIFYDSTGVMCRGCEQIEKRPRTKPLYNLRSIFLLNVRRCCYKTLEHAVWENCPNLVNIQLYEGDEPNYPLDYGCGTLFARAEYLSVTAQIEPQSLIAQLDKIGKTCTDLQQLTMISPSERGHFCFEMKGKDPIDAVDHYMQTDTVCLFLFVCTQELSAP